MFTVIRFLFCMTLLLPGATVAAQSSPISVVTEAKKIQVYIDDQGVEQTRVVPAATVIPGDVIIYKIILKNQGEEIAEGIQIVDPIPEQMIYVPGSAIGPGTDISFSTDGGNNFQSADQLMIEKDGAMRLATPDEYTHIRWMLKHALMPNAQTYTQFNVVLK